MTINELSETIEKAADAKGLYDGKTIPEILAHVHAEVSEAYTADRKGHHVDWKAFNLHAAEFPDNRDHWFHCFVKDSFEDELCDAATIILGLCAHLGIDVERQITEKLEYNESRPPR